MQPWQQEEIDQLEHFVKLAQQPGWWDYVVVRVRELEENGQRDTSPPMFQNLEQKVAARLQDLGFKPPKRAYRKVGNTWERVS
jgi:hypothetical protein